MKQTFFYILFFAALSFSGNALAQAKTFTESHLKAANAVLDVSGMAQSFTSTIDNMIDTQAQQIPDSLQTKFKGVMKTFMTKYFTYEKIKPGMAKIYAAEFTEPELKELAKFYQTPVGKKSAQKLPVLQQKGMELGVAMVQQHQAELQQMMQDAFKK